MAALTRCKNPDRDRINVFLPQTAAQRAAEHPMWYCGTSALPYVAVNEVEQAASRRFGRDSFQTRSTP
jgi:hypothetical protein